jgi:translation initiation factor eIF-2B subunit delta
MDWTIYEMHESGRRKICNIFAHVCQSKQYVLDQIEKFLQERVYGADQMISKYALSKINDNDVIMTYARSHVVEMALKVAWQSGKRFRVIIVDSKPKREGKEMLRRLVKEGLDCSYVMINAVSYMMKEATKVFIGGHTMMYNGNLLSRCGTALVALTAQTYQVPVIVLCETYKFTEKVHLESFSLNELADPDEFVNSSDQQFEEKKSSTEEETTSSGNKNAQQQEKPQTLQNWREVDHLKVLNLAYDLCPAQFITMVITEVGMVPPR